MIAEKRVKLVHCFIMSPCWASLTSRMQGTRRQKLHQPFQRFESRLPHRKRIKAVENVSSAKFLRLVKIHLYANSIGIVFTPLQNYKAYCCYSILKYTVCPKIIVPRLCCYCGGAVDLIISILHSCIGQALTLFETLFESMWLVVADSWQRKGKISGGFKKNTSFVFQQCENRISFLTNDSGILLKFLPHFLKGKGCSLMKSKHR